MEWRDHLPVESQPEHRPLLLEHADDREREAMNADLTPERIEIREIALRHLLTDHDDRGAERIFLLVVDAAPRQREVLDQEILWCRRFGEHLGATLRELRAGIGPGDVVHRPPRARRERLAHREGVLDLNLRSP